MQFTGKRTERMRLPQQLRFQTDLAATVRALAAISRRSYELQILHLVEKGIEFERSGKVNEVINGHILSQTVTR